MLTILLTTALVLASPQDPEPPTEERVEVAIDELEAAFRTKNEAKKLEALEAHKEIEAEEVVEFFASALTDESVEVQKSALDALRWMKHPESLAQLHKLLKRKRPIAKDKEMLPLLLRAIGHHRDPKSIKLLASNVFDDASHDAIRARILSLGNIRSRESVEALMKLMHSAKRQDVQNFMREFRLSLMVLTSNDKGTSQNLWNEWWNKNKKRFKVAKKAPKLPPDEDRAWKRYWGYEYEMARDKRRRKRGSDPEKKR